MFEHSVGSGIWQCALHSELLCAYQTPCSLVHLCRTEMPIPHLHSYTLPEQLPLAEGSAFLYSEASTFKAAYA